MLWLAVCDGALMSLLWVAFLAFSSRVPNQPLRRYYPFFALGFVLLTLILSSLTVGLLGIRDIQQRRAFGVIAMGIFLVTAATTVVILNLRERPTSGKDGSS